MPSEESAEPVPLVRAFSHLANIDLLIRNYANVEFTEQEKDAASDPLLFCTKNSRMRNNYAAVATVVETNSVLRELATGILATPSSSASAERIFSLMGQCFEDVHGSSVCQSISHSVWWSGVSQSAFSDSAYLFISLQAFC